MSYGCRINITSKDKINENNYEILEKIILEMSSGKQDYGSNWCELHKKQNYISLESYKGACFDNQTIDTLLKSFSSGENNIGLIRIWTDYHTMDSSDATDYLCKNGEIVGERTITYTEELDEDGFPVVVGIPSYEFTLEDLDETTFR